NLDRLRVERDEFIRCLRRKGVGTSVHFIPIPIHPYFARLPLAGYPCPRALSLYSRIVSLPFYSGLAYVQQHSVVQSVREVLEDARRPRFVAIGPIDSVQPAGASVSLKGTL